MIFQRYLTPLSPLLPEGCPSLVSRAACFLVPSLTSWELTVRHRWALGLCPPLVPFLHLDSPRSGHPHLPLQDHPTANGYPRFLLLTPTSLLSFRCLFNISTQMSCKDLKFNVAQWSLGSPSFSRVSHTHSRHLPTCVSLTP